MNNANMDVLTNFTQRNVEAINTLMNNDMNVGITVPSGTGADRKMITIPCFISGPITISNLANEWSPLLDFGMFGNLIDIANSSLNLANSLAGVTKDGVRLGGGAQFSLKSRHMTTASWKESGIPTFSLPLIFMSLEPGQNPLDTFLALCRCVLPNSYQETGGSNQHNVVKSVIDTGTSYVASGANAVADLAGQLMKKERTEQEKENLTQVVTQMIQGGVLEAPCGYGIDATNPDNYMVPNRNTTLRLRVGKWLQADNLLVQSLGNPTISRQTMKGSGNPLYVSCNISLRPYKMVTYKEFLSYFLTAQRRENGEEGKKVTAENNRMNVFLNQDTMAIAGETV